MCLAVPAKVVELLDDGMGVVELGNVRREVSMELVKGVKTGDYVIIHVGYALQRLDPEEALKTLALFQEIAEAAAELENQDKDRSPKGR
jgi:hydrogenase expression/formation protein HypC